MGGAVAVHSALALASSHPILGLAVIDVVEGNLQWECWKLLQTVLISYRISPGSSSGNANSFEKSTSAI